MDIYQIFITHNRIWSKLQLLIFCLIMLTIMLISAWLLHSGKIKKTQAMAIILFVAFLWIVLASTVFTREIEPRQYSLIPFGSWRQVFIYHDVELIQEIFLNCILLLPAGCLLPLMRGRTIRLKSAFAVGGGISAVIEVSQLIFRRGVFECDDMIHNALGCMLGCVIVNICIRWIKN